MKEKILICGNYGVGNLGDEAILRALIQYWGKDYEITAMSATPEKTKQKFGIKAVHKYPSGIRSHLRRLITSKGRKNAKETIKAIRNSDRLILGGGTLLTDEPWKSMFVWSAQVKQIEKQGKQIELYANGVGPFQKKWSKRWAKKILTKAKQISVRDERSAQWVKEIIGESPKIIKDPVLNMVVENKKTTNKERKRVAIFALRYWTNNMNETEKTINKFIQYLWLEKGVKSIIVPFEVENKKDSMIMNKIIEQLPRNYGAKIWDDYENEMDVINAISHSELVIGMRLHSLIFANITNTPFIGISYMEKVRSFGKEIKKEAWIVDLEELSIEKLKDIYETHHERD